MKHWVRGMIGLCLLLIMLPVSAQTALSQVVDLGDGYSISIPADWKATAKQNYMVLENPDLVFFVITPSVIDSVGMNISTHSTHAELVINFSILIEALGTNQTAPNADNIREAVFNRRKALTYVDASGSADQEHILLYLSDNRLGYLIVMARKGQLEASNTLISDIIASFDNTRLAAAATQSPDIDHVGETNPLPTEPSDAPTAESGSLAVGALPSGGRWTLTLKDVTNLSCGGGDKVLIASDKVYVLMAQSFSLSVTNANTFIFGDGYFTRIPRTNSFTGSFAYQQGMNTQVSIDLQSPTAMEGQMKASPNDGSSCNATTSFQASHR